MKRKSNKVVQKRERMRRAVIAFYQDNKKWPSSTAKDPKEMRMGMWISRTRYLKNHHPERLPEKIMDLIDWIDEEKIQMNLDQWENSYQKLKEFIDKNERWPALGSPDPAEAKLYNWCTTQRGLKKKPKRDRVIKNRIAKLDAIGFKWEVNPVRPWKESFELVKEFYAQHQRWPVHTPRNEEESKLAKWCSLMRSCRNKPKSTMKLTPTQIRKLTQIGFEWEPKRTYTSHSKEQLDKWWMERFNEFNEFITKKKRYPNTKTKCKNAKEATLYTWWMRMAYLRRAGKLQEDRIQLLDSIGFRWGKSK